MNRPDRNPRRPLPALLGVLLLACAPPLLALTGDREKPIELEADSAEIDERTGVSVYTGNVRVTQGSTQLLADRLTVTQGVDGDELVAEGRPARFSQLPDGKPQPVEGEALTIRYHTGEEVVVLTGDAEVRQSGDRFASQRIVYESATDTVRGGQASPGAQPGDRVKITIQPREKEPKKAP